MRKKSFENYIAELQKILEKLESGEESLETSLKLYEDGINISKQCKEILENAKQKVTVLENAD